MITYYQILVASRFSRFERFILYTYIFFRFVAILISVQKVAQQMDSEAEQRQAANVELEGRLNILRTTLIGRFCDVSSTSTKGDLCHGAFSFSSYY